MIVGEGREKTVELDNAQYRKVRCKCSICFNVNFKSYLLDYVAHYVLYIIEQVRQEQELDVPEVYVQT